jgi:hypothetical protein
LSLFLFALDARISVAEPDDLDAPAPTPERKRDAAPAQTLTTFLWFIKSKIAKKMYTF